MIVKLGFIYCLKHPVKGEIFYVGSTEVSPHNRLRSHYQQLKEVQAGTRKSNRKFDYLLDLLPLKAEVSLLELVQDADLYKREIFHIKVLRKLNPALTNMTDGGKGNHTCKYYTEREMEEYSAKLSKSLKGKPKPKSFAENMSIARKGLGNPMVKELSKWIVSFKDGKPELLFKHAFEIDALIGKRGSCGNIHKAMKRKHYTPYGRNWELFENCSKKVQDIVQSAYESKQ